MLANTRMFLNAQQHRAIAARYRRPPDPDWTAEDRARALMLATAHEVLAMKAEKRALEAAKRGEPPETDYAAIWP